MNPPNISLDGTGGAGAFEQFRVLPGPSAQALLANGAMIMTVERRLAVPVEERKKLVVVFDTNSIFTDSKFYILNEDVKRLINETRDLPSIQVRWLLPSVVLEERFYRLRQKASSMLESISSISGLIGRDLGVNEDVLINAIDHRVQKMLGELDLEVREPIWPDIDLEQIVGLSTNRQPPFNPGNSEKGFRDAMILETYVQVLSDSEFSDYQAVLVTSDDLLIKAVNKRTETFDNQYPPGSIEDIRGIIAAISEELELELVEMIIPVASEYFFTPADPSSVFSQFGIPSTIQKEYESAFLSHPPGSDIRNTYAPSIHQSRFVKKEDDRFFWSNLIVFPSVAYRIAYSVGPTASSIGHTPSGIFSTDIYGDELSSSSTGQVYSSSSAFLPPNPSYVPVSNGRTIFEVIWSAVYTDDGRFVEPRVDDLIFRGTDWS